MIFLTKDFYYLKHNKTSKTLLIPLHLKHSTFLYSYSPNERKFGEVLTLANIVVFSK